MKAIVAALIGLTALSSAPEQPRSPYDADLAKKLGADEYGMKVYALVLLKSGPRQDLSKAESDQAFAGHMANINRLADTRDLVFAGPLQKNDRYRGIFVFNVKTQAEAEALVATDPAVIAGALAGDVYMLYGSAALQEVTDIHRRISFKQP
ncbi:MAG: hypothetical protein JJE39_05785 [Vicinamibacteria bacterium]|nr:hypothetical protein [Vicinamibacteria bacterium]